MPYVDRDKDGKIIGVYVPQQYEGQEFVTDEVARAERKERDYKEKRFAEYPNVYEQLDDLYHLGYDGWKAKIKAIKDKYPKPAEE